MKLNEIYLKDVARSIEGVVKADDVEHLAVEVEEYVLTNDAAKGVAPMLEEYTNYSNANGVWISGFFGSGKSHLLKMLAHLLGDVDGQSFDRDQVAKSFLRKTDDAMLQASLQKAASIPAKSLLFNIDQKATLISKDQTDALLKVFVKVFNESRGYFGNDGAVARFEETLDERGQYKAFKDAFERHAKISWAQGREQAALEAHNIDKAFEEVNGEANPGIIASYQRAYAVSIEDFANSVKSWIDKQEPGYRLNFFVDEVGQFIADDVKLMLNLQTIAESLNTKCKGQAWVFVTSQEDMDRVIGDRTRDQGNDFSKIQARFKSRVKLTSQDVEEVISKRLLEKNADGEAALSTLYKSESANFSTLFTFSAGAKTYRNYIDEAKFVSTYPFVTYQIPMFQAAIEGLSEHNMFEGKNSSVGERSMLGVVQEVAKLIGSEDVGYLATFDQMFAGISAALKSAAQSAILQAERHLPDPNSEVTVLANRILKALFLVKYVDTFKATPTNLAILVYDRFGQDLHALGQRVQEALDLLESQSYVQRSGNLYEYLTNEEQEIEKEIKAVEVDASEVSARLFQLLSSDIVKLTKIRYQKNGQDFQFGYKLDDLLKGTQRELTLHFISPESPYTDEEIVQQGMGRHELTVDLGRDASVLNELRLALKTSKYVKQRMSNATAPSTLAILQTKQAVLAEREKEIVTRLREQLGNARLIVNGSTISSAAKDPVARIEDGFQELVNRTYPSLGLLGGKVYAETAVAQAVQGNPSLFPDSDLDPLNSAATEVESWVISQTKLGEQITLKKIEDRFTTKPYGWDLGSIEVVVGWLVGNGKLSLTIDATPVARSEAAAVIRNATKRTQTVVTVQKSFDPAKVTAFRAFCMEFLDDPSVPTDPAEMARYGEKRLAEARSQIAGLVVSSPFPFVSQLGPVVDLLDSVTGKPTDWYLEQFDLRDDLLDAKENVLDPIRAFLSGSQASIYTNAQAVLKTAEDNQTYLPDGAADAVKALLGDLNIFRGNKANQLKARVDELEGVLGDALSAETTAGAAAVEAMKAQLTDSDEFAKAPEEVRQLVLNACDSTVSSIRAQKQIAVARQIANEFQNTGFASLLNKLSAAAAAESGETEKISVPASSVSVRPGGTILESASDVDSYVESLREAMYELVAEGKRVVL